MLNYTSLFNDLEAFYEGAGQDPRSFRRLAREVRRVRESLDDYTHEVSQDYVLRFFERSAPGMARDASSYLQRMKGAVR